MDRLRKKIEDINFINAMNIAAATCNSETFSNIKNCFNGRQVALCGAGPSLKNYKPIDNTVHIALNRALLFDKVDFDWFIGEDWAGFDFIQKELKNYDCVKFFGHHQDCWSIQIPEDFAIECGAKKFYTDSYIVSTGYDSRFICDIDKMVIGNMPNIALTAMQIVLFTNPDKVFLVGCDASPGHFVQPDSLDSNRIKLHEKDLKVAVSSDKAIKKWLELKEFAKVYYPHTEIVSINPVGLKGIFTDVFQ